MAASVLLDAQGRRVLSASGKQQTGNCCYVNAIKCDNSVTNLWMRTSDALTIVSFKYLGQCYKFGGAAVPCLPQGAILLTPSQVQTFPTCAACIGGGSPCSRCSGTTPAAYLAIIQGVANCVTYTGDADYQVFINGSYLIPQSGGIGPCDYRATYTGSYGGSYGENSGCTGENSPFTTIKLFYNLISNGLDIAIDSTTVELIAFSGSFIATAPYDCLQSRSITNGVTQWGGSATIIAQ